MKAVLVIDLPLDCWDCHLVDDWENCNAIKITSRRYGMNVKQYYKNERPSWCPLRPLPQKNKYDVKKYATVDYENNVTLGHYLNKGRNECIDEITGETE